MDRILRQNDQPGLLGLLGSLPVALGIKPPFNGHHAEGTVMHCPYQVVHPLPPKAWRLPYVINLHDIQHEHLPDFFSPKELAWRREAYLASARHAMAVCVVDEWTRRDVLAHLPIEASKVFVAPFGPTWAKPAPLTPERVEALTQSYGLPGQFLFYPAQTWPHKNHGRLLEALALLRRDKGLAIPLVCTGHLNEHHQRLVKQVADLGLAERVHFLGLIPAEDIQAFYQMAVGVVIPTLFEGGPGIPVLESMALGAPLAAARSCGIPDAVGDACLLFDPLSIPDMARAVEILWTREDIRRELVERGRTQMSGWSWERATATYAEIYEEVLAQWNFRPGA